MDYKLLGAKIREERNNKRMSQQQLAEAADKSVSFIGQIERAETVMSIDTLVKISKVLDVTVDYLVSDTKTVEPDIVVQEINYRLDKLDCNTQKLVLNFIKMLEEHKSNLV